MNKNHKFRDIPAKGKVQLDESIERIDRSFKELLKKRLKR